MWRAKPNDENITLVPAGCSALAARRALLPVEFLDSKRRLSSGKLVNSNGDPRTPCVVHGIFLRRYNNVLRN